MHFQTELEQVPYLLFHELIVAHFKLVLCDYSLVLDLNFGAIPPKGGGSLSNSQQNSQANCPNRKPCKLSNYLVEVSPNTKLTKLLLDWT